MKADLTGASIKTMVKRNVNDADAAAILTKQVGSGIAIIAPATNGESETTITAAETNVITYDVVYVETVVKLSNGEFIRSGVDRLEIKGNVLKTLF